MTESMSDEGFARTSRGALWLGAVVVACVAMLIVPLPTPLLDVLLTLNLALSVAVLLVAAWAGRALELSAFPTLLVLATLARLALNVSTVRLILLQADAGRVVHAFGAFVVRGDYVVGLAVFLILATVQYVVIARGAERVAEVAARFALDALPGQQLAIDAELRAGTLDADGARRRRAELKREAELYGALDGAMRFVKGDVIAALAILTISLAGGLTIGVVQRGMPLGDAARTYTLLTIGDGIVSLVPALLTATAAGLVVTRSSSQALPGELGRLLLKPRALMATAALLALLALVPGLPLWPFALAGAAVGAVGLVARRREAPADAPAEPRAPAPLSVVLDAQLAAQVGDLAPRLQRVARREAEDLGLVLPAVAVHADARLPLRGWEVRLRDVPLLRGVIPDGRVLAEGGPAALPEGVDAEPAEHPATGALASWVPTSQRGRLEALGVPVHDAPSCLALALAQAVRKAAPELLGVDETQRLLRAHERDYPALVREVVPRRIDLARLAEVLRRLLAEGVPVSDLRDVLEAVARERELPADTGELVERVRAQLQRRLTHRFAASGRVDALMLDGEAEDAVRDAVRGTPTGPRLALEPDFAEALLSSVRREREAHPGAVLLAPAELRRHLRQLLAAEQPEVPVLAFHELLPDVEVERVGTLRLY